MRLVEPINDGFEWESDIPLSFKSYPRNGCVENQKVMRGFTG
jgi:hypothetical protein